MFTRLRPVLIMHKRLKNNPEHLGLHCVKVSLSGSRCPNTATLPCPESHEVSSVTFHSPGSGALRSGFRLLGSSPSDLAYSQGNLKQIISVLSFLSCKVVNYFIGISGEN